MEFRVEQVKDYYKVLGVGETASAEDIRKAYRKLAKQHHPDKHKGDKVAEERFKEINEANDTLSDAKRREEYDMMRKYGASFGAGAGPGGGYGGYAGGSTAGFGGFEDIFRQFTGAGATRGRGGAGFGFQEPEPRDSEAEATLPFDTAVRGGEYAITLTDADGTHRDIKVRIPAGVADGQTIRLSGQGTRGHSGRRADLLLHIRVAPHPTFRREKNDLLVDVKISLRTAVLGGQMRVPTMDGNITIKVAPGTQSGRVFRVKGKGVSTSKGHVGDLLATATVEIPLHLSEEQIKLFTAFANSLEDGAAS